MFAYVLLPDLRGTDDGLAGRVAASDHHLLGDKDFLRWDLDPQVAAGNHHTVALSQDLLKTDRAIRRREAQDSGFGRDKKRGEAAAEVEDWKEGLPGWKAGSKPPDQHFYFRCKREQRKQNWRSS